MSRAYYNEIDPYAAQWLRNLIAAGHIAPGDVDERSIRDVTPTDLAGYTQCHFFAGIGVWSYALRLAGWPDDRPVWTGSCPCQPFSAAGRGDGAADPRHLWPAWFKLIRECSPNVCFGEQVASADGLAWLDLVHADLEAAGYAVGALDLCAAGADLAYHPMVGQALKELEKQNRQFVLAGDYGRAEEAEDAISMLLGLGIGAPHIRQRLYFVADAGHAEGWSRPVGRSDDQPEAGGRDEDAGGAGERGGASVILGDAAHYRPQERARKNREQEQSESGQSGLHAIGANSTGGFWSDAIWLPCRDGKARATKPGLFPLAHGAAARVGRLRAYGNAIVAPQAAEFIRAYMSVTP